MSRDPCCQLHPPAHGISEEIIGRWLAQGGGRPERIVLATKVYHPMDTGFAGLCLPLGHGAGDHIVAPPDAPPPRCIATLPEPDSR